MNSSSLIEKGTQGILNFGMWVMTKFLGSPFSKSLISNRFSTLINKASYKHCLSHPEYLKI